VCDITNGVQLLTALRQPYLSTVSVNCKDTRIAVQVRTNKPFNGRIYALGRSETCNIDVQNSDLFRLDLTMSGQDCNTQSVVSFVHQYLQSLKLDRNSPLSMFYLTMMSVLKIMMDAGTGTEQWWITLT
jgi:hypothetical protein